MLLKAKGLDWVAKGVSIDKRPNKCLSILRLPDRTKYARNHNCGSLVLLSEILLSVNNLPNTL